MMSKLIYTVLAVGLSALCVAAQPDPGRGRVEGKRGVETKESERGPDVRREGRTGPGVTARGPGRELRRVARLAGVGPDVGGVARQDRPTRRAESLDARTAFDHLHEVNSAEGSGRVAQERDQDGATVERRQGDELSALRGKLQLGSPLACRRDP